MVKTVFAVIVTFVALTQASAAPISHVVAAARVNDASGDTGWSPVTHYESTPGALTQAALLPGGQAFGSASSGPGYAKAEAMARNSGGAYTIGFGSGGYSETITLSAAGMEGQVGQLTAVFLLDYSMSSSAPNSMAYLNFSAGIGRSGANVLASALHDGTNEIVSGGYEVNDALGHRMQTISPVTAVSITSDFIWGEAFMISYRMLVQAIASGPLATSASVDASHSAYWGGISAVSSGGQLVTDFLVTSESGADYSKSFAPTQEPTPVPEPSSISLVLAGAYLIKRKFCGRATAR